MNHTDTLDQFLVLQHAIAGRLRLHMPIIGGHAPMRERVQQRLATVDGVRRTRINVRCASLIVRYDPKRLTQKQVISAV